MADGSAPTFEIALSSNLSDAAPHGFFAPVRSCDVEVLFRRHDAIAEHIAQIAQNADDYFGETLRFFSKGNLEPDSRIGFYQIEKMFQKDGALAALAADFWQHALMLTDVYEHMPQKRRDDWNEQIRQQKTPDFTPDTVIPTLRELLGMRETFLAERVDGIFRALSGEHVTNRPEGFSKRMIMSGMLSYGTVCYQRVGYLHDLRAVVARFMGRDEVTYTASSTLADEMQRATGQWVVIDGGALKVRLYKKGTMHVEVHPDMAWRLNAVLSHLYPQAIPASFRQHKARERKHDLLQRPLPFTVLAYLSEDTRYMPETIYRLQATDFKKPSPARDEAIALIESLGGEKSGEHEWEFDYDYREAFRQVLLTGCVPDKKTHQSYLTPPELAARVRAAAAVGPGDTVLEPSAGQGALIEGLAADQVTCIEIARLRVAVLQGKGYNVTQGDFIEVGRAMAAEGRQFSRIIMNPPFSQGRATMHLKRAMSLLAPGGRLVAILPSGHRSFDPGPGFRASSSEIIDNGFSDASVSVVILTVERLGGAL